MATYAQRPQGMALTSPFETGGLGKYSNQPIVIMGGACSVGQYGTYRIAIDRLLILIQFLGCRDPTRQAVGLQPDYHDGFVAK